METRTAIDLSGAAFDPFKAASGKAVVLVFVRTDCPVSNRYVPTLEQIRSHFAKKAAFWFVYPDRAESAEKIRQHEKEFNLRIPAIRDPQHVLVKLTGATITPEATVFDANRHLIYHGRIDNLYEDFGHKRSSPTTHELMDAVQAALSGNSLSNKATPAVGCYISDLE